MNHPFSRITQIVGLVWCLCLAFAVRALEPDRNLIEFHLQSWQTQHGLPHNMVQSIAQTPDGYLWFGTWEGVTRFNGLEFTVFDPYSVPQLLDRGVRALLVSRDGALWLGTSRGGVTRLKDNLWTTVTREDGLAGNEILSLAEDSEGRIWVGTEADGVGIIDGGPVGRFGPEDGLNDKAVLAMAERVPGEMWLTTRNGVVRIIGEEVTAFGAADGLPAGPVLSVVSDGEGALLFGTQDGIYWWYEGVFMPHSGWAIRGRGQVPRLLRDSDGLLWAGTFSEGLFRIRETRLDNLSTRSGLPNNRISALFEDREGNLWVGTSGGLARLKAAPFSVLAMRNGLSDNYVRALLETSDGSLWVGTSNGLNRIRGTDNRIFTTDDGLTTNSVLSLLETDDGSLWIGTYGSGINILRDERLQSVLAAPYELPSNHIRSMRQTRDGAIWVGTIAGLTKFVDGEPELTLDDTNGLPREYVQALFEDDDGTLWIGTIEGLARIRDNKVESLMDLDGYEGSDVFDFHRDAQDNLWIATETGLLHLGDDDVARPVKRLHGLPHDVLFGLTSDGLGQLWMSSNAGVFRARITDLLDVVHGRKSTAPISRYSEDDGLASRQSNGGSQPSVIQASSGRLWFATAVGAAVVDPQILLDDSANNAIPTVVIEKVLIDGVPQDLSRTVHVSPGARHFEIHYAGLSFRSPESIRYRHQLQGFEEPRQAGHERIAHYTNLDPGLYNFRAWGALESGQWSPQPAEILLRVDPYFYETRWFVGLVAAFAALLVWAGVRYRIASLRRRARELAREVAARTRDLKQQTRRLEQANSEKTDLLEKIEEQSRAFEQQAREDALTGLANRRHFDEILEREFDRARSAGHRLSLALLDVDHFKSVNDQFSHAAGDEVLKRLAGLMIEVFGENATPARYGGEEFVVLLPDDDLEQARARCERFREQLEAMDLSDVAEGLKATISIGVSDRTDVANHEKMVTDADHKLYEAKKGGRNQVVA